MVMPKINSFDDLKLQATKLHRKLCTMPYINTYVTTNWDRYFEEICHAKPFVYDPDMRFWEIPRRRVLKIHGTIDNYSSLVASRNDYSAREKELHVSLVGGKLKELLTSKTCVFTGYSMRDEDFREIFSFVKSAQGRFSKTHYFVSPHPCHLEFKDLIVIPTDGSYFFRILKQHFCNNSCYIDDTSYDFVREYLMGLRDAHNALWSTYNLNEFPQVIIPGCYQDGLIHGCEMILDARGTGVYSDMHSVCGKIEAYEEKISYYKGKRSYSDVAYFRGYANALISLATFKLDGEFTMPPLYYLAGAEELDCDAFHDLFESAPNLHKAAFRECKKMAGKLPKTSEYVYQHMPWG